MFIMHVTGEHGCVAFSFASLPRTGVESKILIIEYCECSILSILALSSICITIESIGEGSGTLTSRRMSSCSLGRQTQIVWAFRG